jgi:signal recognition particle subunit SRP54
MPDMSKLMGMMGGAGGQPGGMPDMSKLMGMMGGPGGKQGMPDIGAMMK